MKNIWKKILIICLIFTPQLALAARCMVNGKEVPCDQFPWWIFIFIFGIIGLVLIFWLWMIIDCAKNQKENKTFWILLLIFFQGVAAIVYFFVVKRKRSNAILENIIQNNNSQEAEIGGVDMKLNSQVNSQVSYQPDSQSLISAPIMPEVSASSNNNFKIIAVIVGGLIIICGLAIAGYFIFSEKPSVENSSSKMMNSDIEKQTIERAPTPEKQATESTSASENQTTENIASNSNDAVTLYRLGVEKYNSGSIEGESFVDLWIKSTEADPNYIPPFLALGDFMVKTMQWEDAATFYLQAKTIKEDNEQTILRIGNLAYKTERYFAAITSLNKVKEINPSNINASIGLAKCYIKLSSKKTALQYIDEAIALSVNDSDFHKKVMACKSSIEKDQASCDDLYIVNVDKLDIL